MYCILLVFFPAQPERFAADAFFRSLLPPEAHCLPSSERYLYLLHPLPPTYAPLIPPEERTSPGQL